MPTRVGGRWAHALRALSAAATALACPWGRGRGTQQFPSCRFSFEWLKQVPTEAVRECIAALFVIDRGGHARPSACDWRTNWLTHGMGAHSAMTDGRRPDTVPSAIMQWQRLCSAQLRLFDILGKRKLGRWTQRLPGVRVGRLGLSRGRSRELGPVELACILTAGGYTSLYVWSKSWSCPTKRKGSFYCRIIFKTEWNFYFSFFLIK